MTLENLQKEMINAMKNKDKIRKETISTLIQSIKKFGIDNKCKDNITEDQINTIILKEKKICQEMIDTCPDNRPDIKNSYEKVMNIINEFAPILMVEPIEIQNFILSLGIEPTKANRGKIMASLKGKADMRVANVVVSKMIQ